MYVPIYDPIIRDIPGFENYQISEFGEVYNKTTGKEMSIIFNRDGYKCFYICSKKGKQYGLKVHRVLATIFIPNPDNKLEVDHVDRCKSNNKLENLRWATRKENNTNKSFQCNNTSGFIGIRFHINKEGRKYWHAYITSNKKQIYKYFEGNDEGFELAKAWRIQKEIEIFGKFRAG